MSSAVPLAADRRTTRHSGIQSEDVVQTVLDVLDDADCRQILETTADDPMTASELSTECGLPLSTTYRKLDMLTEAGFLAERTRVRLSGKHTSEYSRIFEGVTISSGPGGGLELRVSRRDGIQRSGIGLSADEIGG